MSSRSKKIVGIIGGMGPECTAELFLQITALTPVRIEQDHLHVIIDSNPEIPDRTGFLLGQNESPLPLLLESVARLEAVGAEVVGIACNTAHYWYRELQAATEMQILNMVELAAQDAAKRTKPGELVGIMATTGTIRMKLYEKALAAAGRKTLVPDDADQERVMECIYGARGIKLGYVSENRRGLEEVWTRLAERGATTAIAGCTEVMLPFRQECSLPLVDPITVLAGQLVELAGA